MATRNYQSIGEVLVAVKTEFPDITISKIRFLEAEGLIEPERTPSGYRKFYAQDLDTLKSILRMQRDEYLPLKVIKERLLKQEADEDVELDADGEPVEAPAEEVSEEVA
jgi:DNA-binding transcriptional MerR regulator